MKNGSTYKISVMRKHHGGHVERRFLNYSTAIGRRRAENRVTSEMLNRFSDAYEVYVRPDVPEYSGP